MNFSQEFIENVKNANDIIDVANSYISLKKKGNSYFGLCPFHREKTPSFAISQDKQIYHCFGCGEGGTVIQLIERLENLEFPEAIEFLADRANLVIPKMDVFADNKKEILREKCYKVNEEASNFFVKNLFMKEAKIPQEYIKSRKLTKDTILEFKIGYSGRGLYNHLKEKGFGDEEIFETGLAYKRNDGRVIDRFIDRLMFTLKDPKGRVIGFSGRRLGEDKEQAKYINSNDNLVYNKGRNLFAIEIAKKYSQEEIIVVEGQMDAISLHQRGIKNVVASLGTALTESQSRLLLRYSKKIIIAYDSDTPGMDATIRGLDILKTLGADLKVLQLENAKDPDEYIVKFGAENLKEQIKNSISLFEFKEKWLKSKYDISKLEEKAKFIVDIVKELRKVESIVEREIYIKRISENNNISEESINNELNRIGIGNKNSNSDINVSLEKFEENKYKSENLRKSKNENYELECVVIRGYIENPECINKYIIEITKEMFEDETNKKIIDIIYNLDNSQKENIFNYFENLKETNQSEENNLLYSRIIEIISKDIIVNPNVLEKVKNTFKLNMLIQEEKMILLTMNDSSLDDESKKILLDRFREISLEKVKYKK